MKGLFDPGAIVAGKYEVERVLGEGGMGRVIAARQAELRRHVAIKVMRPELASNAGAVARFLREARAAVQLESEHVARIIDVGTEGDVPFMVMELLSGEDLAARLTRLGPCESLGEAIDYLLQACAAIAEAHAAGVIHRDLKPANLFLAQRRDGGTILKVLDFGISKSHIAGDAPPLPALTDTQSIIGTPLYASPEQLRSSRSVDHRTDIWSLGVIGFELLTGRLPFDAESVSALIAAVAADPPVELTALRPDVPPDLAAALMRCLEKRPRDRFESVSALALSLAPFAPAGRESLIARMSRMSGPERVSIVPSTTQVPSGAAATERAFVHPTSPPRNGRRTTLVLGAAALVALLVGAATVFTTMVPPPPSATMTVPSVRVLLEATPAGAQLMLDGAKLPSNPYSLELRRGSAPRLVEAHASGFLTSRAVVATETDSALRLVLVKEAPANSAAPPVTAPKASAASTEATAPKSGLRPGETEPRRGRTGRSIIEKDPWQ